MMEITENNEDILLTKAEEILTRGIWYIDPKMKELQMTEEKNKVLYSSNREAIVGRAGLLQGRFV